MQQRFIYSLNSTFSVLLLKCDNDEYDMSGSAPVILLNNILRVEDRWTTLWHPAIIDSGINSKSVMLSLRTCNIYLQLYSDGHFFLITNEFNRIKRI